MDQIINKIYITIFLTFSLVWVAMFIYSIAISDQVSLIFVFVIFIASIGLFLILTNPINELYFENYSEHFDISGLYLLKLKNIISVISIFIGLFIFIKIVIISLL